MFPIFGFSQINDDFLTLLFVDTVEIKNQDFKLELSGFINTKGTAIKTNNNYDDKLSEVLFLDDISLALSNKSSVYLGDYVSDPYSFESKCTWNWSGENSNLNMTSPESLDLFPKLSFIKGKLLTISDADSSKDYLFSVSKTTKYENYGYNTMYFNLTDENEQAYLIQTIVIDNKVYIMLTKREMERLGFKSKFSNYSNFKILCGSNKRDYTEYITSNYRVSSKEAYLKDCWCSCDKNYINIFKKPTLFMNKSYNLNEEDLIYLFKLTVINNN